MLNAGLIAMDAERAFGQVTRSRRRAAPARRLRGEPGESGRLAGQRIRVADQRAVLPPISAVPFKDGYAVLDGHHRVSVANARGALTIDATVEAGPR